MVALDELLLEDELTRLRAIDDFARKLTEILVDGGGVAQIVMSLAARLGHPVVLEREDGALLHYAAPEIDDGAALTAWYSASESLSFGVPGEHGGRLVVVAAPACLPAVAQALLERAAGAVALCARHKREQELLHAQTRGALLLRLLEGGLSDTEMERQARAMGFTPGIRYLLPCVLAPIRPRHGIRAGADDMWAMVWRDVRRELDDLAVPVLGGLLPGGRQVALVVGLMSDAQRDQRADALAAHFAAVLNRHTGAAAAGVLHVGAAATSWSRTAAELGEVLEAAESPMPLEHGWHDVTVPNLDAMLWRLRDNPQLRAFVQRRLGPLVEHDRQRSVPLLKTLEAFLECGGSKAAAARALHLERQSIYPRLERIEALLGVSLDDAQTRLGVHLALRAARLTTRHPLDCT